MRVVYSVISFLWGISACIALYKHQPVVPDLTIAFLAQLLSREESK